MGITPYIRNVTQVAPYLGIYGSPEIVRYGIFGPLEVQPAILQDFGDDGGDEMFDGITMNQLRAQIDQHLLMVEEVLGGMDAFLQQLEKRVSRIEEGLGLEPEGVSASGWIADLQRVKGELSAIRGLVK
jgi:hypothetical protein